MSTSSPPPSPSASLHLPALDVLRGAAILGVIWHHLFAPAFPSGWWFDSVPLYALLGPIASNGWLGVNLFFILSGFVLYWPLTTGQRRLATGTEIRSFYKRRAIRLFPLFYLSVLVMTGVGSSFNLRSQLALLTLTFNFHRDTFLPYPNFVLWSLGVEIWFSVLFPVVVMAVTRFGWRPVAAVVMGAALGARLTGALLPELGLPGNPFLHPLRDSLIGRMDDFFVGMALASLHARGYQLRRRGLTIAAGLLMCFASCLLSDAVVSGHTQPLLMAFVNTALQGGAALVILGVLALPRFRIYPLELAGMMCYSIYVWHGVVMWHMTPYPHTPLSIAKYFLVLAPLAWLSYRYIEFGSVKELAKLLPRKSLPLAAPSPTRQRVGVDPR